MELWTKKNLEQQINNNEIVSLYLYAPICGTCNVAEKMLTVAAQLVPQITYAKADLNYHAQFANKYRIMSVPCLLLFSKGDLNAQIYAFKSVQYLQSELIKLRENNNT